MRIAPDQPSGRAPSVRIDQQLVGVEAVAMLGLIGSVNTVAIELSGRDIVEIAVPNVFGTLGQFDAFEFASAENSAKLVPRPSQLAPRREDVPAVRRMRQLSGTRNIAAKGGMVRLSSGTRPSNAWTSPTFPTLLPP